MKACLVAKGYEEESSNMRTDSPTCSRECFLTTFYCGIMYGLADSLH